MRPRFDEKSATAGTLCIGPLLGMAVAYNIAKAQGAVTFANGSLDIVDPVYWRNCSLLGAIAGFVPALIIAIIFWNIYKKTTDEDKRKRLLYIMFFLIMSLVIIAASCMTSFSGT